jgi:hypothetical protein
MASVGLGIAACTSPNPIPNVTPRVNYTPPPTNPTLRINTATPVPPTAVPLPTLPDCPTPNPTATLDPNEGLDEESERIAAVYEAVLAYHGDLPVEVVLAVAAAETGDAYHWNNEINDDGIMQVTSASGHHQEHGAYTNTRAGIEANIQDGVAVLDDYRARIRNETKDNRYGDYGDIFDDKASAEIIRTMLHFNGGNNPISLYAGDPDRGIPPAGTKNYLGRVADKLETKVPQIFGQRYANTSLVKELRDSQTLVDQAVANKLNVTPIPTP